MKTALVVDDTEIHRSATRTFLSMSGFKVEIAQDGIEALKILDAKTFDVIFSDIEMPNMNGMELLKRIRKHATAGKTPVVMLSTLDSAEMQTKLKQLGANHYLVKPFSGDRMKTALQAVGF
ncbi:MAG: response regulator [Candidatus Kapabacteria bacterium]|jgi:DNA-binding response OmpR family regulator|nr:response regulator [Candidatus Kapabacteria bacterium]